MAEVRWSLAAESDLRSIEEFVARESPLRAVGFLDRLIRSVGGLEAAPRRGRVVPEYERPDLSEVIFRATASPTCWMSLS